MKGSYVNSCSFARASALVIASAVVLGVVVLGQPGPTGTSSPAGATGTAGNVLLAEHVAASDTAAAGAQITNYNSHLCLGISGGRDNAPAIQWRCDGSPNQAWKWGSGYGDSGARQLVNGGGECLGVLGGSTRIGAQIAGWTCVPAHQDQYWIPLGNSCGGYYPIENLKSHQVIGVSGNSTAEGAHVVQWTDQHQCNNQFWSFGVPASSAVPPPSGSAITLGIHDGAINMCDRGGAQTTPPTAAELAAATSSLTSKYWPALKTSTVRFSPPWDIAYHHDGPPSSVANRELAVIQTCFNAWLAGMRNAGARPEIAFKPDPSYRSPDGAFVGAPDIHTYRLAIDAFTREYSNPASTHGMARVQIISPWGEPDDPAKIFMPQGGHLLSDPNCHGSPRVNTCGPILAAHMWQAVRASCKRCDLLGGGPGSGVIAGDFSSLGGIRAPEAGSGRQGSYLDVYRKNLGQGRPAVWALHPYSDIMAFEKADAAHQPGPNPATTLVSQFAGDLSAFGYHQHTQIWLDEISAFQYYNQSGAYRPGWTPSVQADAGHYLLTGLPKAAGGPGEPKVTRAYYLNFQAADPINSRWALILNGGLTPQPIYDTFVNR